jgi:hypothetical protein
VRAGAFRGFLENCDHLRLRDGTGYFVLFRVRGGAAFELFLLLFGTEMIEDRDGRARISVSSFALPPGLASLSELRAQ